MLSRRRLFHYTPGCCLPDILASKVILVTGLHVPEHERPAAWFSLHHDWEPTCHKGVISDDGAYRRLGRAGIAQLWGLVRIEIDPKAAPYTWAQHRSLSGITKAEARELERIAHQWGAKPDDWRVSYDEVEAEHWRTIEVNDGSGWADLESAYRASRMVSHG